MTPNMKMETTSGGGVGKVFSRMMSGESLFFKPLYRTKWPRNDRVRIQFSWFYARNQYFCQSRNDCTKIRIFGSRIRRTAFYCFPKKIGGGFFGGEGFIMQRLSGQGTAFIEIDGYAMEYLLQPGQSMIVDTGYLAAMSETCTIDVQKVPGVKNMLFGGEGIFNTVVTGPGTIILQTMPINQMAAVLRPFFPSNKLKLLEPVVNMPYLVL